MAVPLLEPAFSTGEVSPSLFGRFDLARMHVAASTLRNLFVSYRGGAYSRAGTKFVGFSKQTGRSYPPRLITFSFSINQGLALEFGNHYMRVISNGAFVTEPALPISNITQANPARVTSAGSGVTAATPINTSTIASYAPGDQVTLLGGTFLTPAVLAVTNTKIVSLALNSPGTGGYVPADTINLSGGTQSTPAVVVVSTTKVVSATVAAAGASGTPGTATVTGTTGTGTKFQAQVTIDGGGAISSVDSITVGGSYTVNPTVITAEPVTGGGLVGAQLSVLMGVGSVTIFNAGVFTANPAGGTFTQGSTSGVGTGATFLSAVMGPNAVTIANSGVYSVVPANPVSQDSTTGTGLGATFTLTTASVAAFANGDWVYITGVTGMTQVNGETYVIGNVVGTSFDLLDVYGNNINSTAFGAYTGGGTIARIYTVVAPYAEADLPYLKLTQSADVMSLTCVNQDTGTEYQAYDLVRNSNTDWSFEAFDPTPSVSPPTNVAGSASAGGSTYYQYVVTSVDPDDGTESVASDIANIAAAVDIAATAGRITLTWTPVPGVRQYNVYKATPQYGAAPPVGAQFGFAGISFGGEFIDSNIVADFSQTPPKAANPFARGQVIGASTIAAGTGYTSATVTINTGTGSGAELEAIIVNGGVVGFLLISAGMNYLPTDTITITGTGVGALASLQVGSESGTYPGAVAYFQERRVYGYTINAPDTYFMSQPGAFHNFDVRTPTIDSDAITGSPWSVQVNGIQFMVPMPGGLVVLTGLSAWQLTGTGGSSLNPQAITPSTQQAQPQAYNGCNNKIPPIQIDYDILYVQAKGSIYRDLSYQFYTNIYTGADLTLNSSQLFTGFNMVEHAWCEEPNKVLWAVRDDGAMLSLTFVKPQEVAGWARHDTAGLFQSVCSVTEPPVDALYTAVQRFPGANTAYMIERMDNRIWSSLDDVWCVDAGLKLTQPTPAATLAMSSATGLGAITGTSALIGGTGYSANTTASVVDDNGLGTGTGAVPVLTIVGGVITAVTFAPGSRGTGYSRPALVITDPAGTGSGAEAVLVLDNTATFTASAAVFAPGDVGKIIRAGGGVATVTGYTSTTRVTVNITTPITALIPNTGGRPRPQTSGNWTMTTPVTSISGLTYLAGATVTGLADGVVIPPVVVPSTGIITLPQASTAVVVGLGFQAQMQSVYLDGGEPTVQGQRKKIAAVTARIEASRGLKMGSNQPDGSTLNPPQLAPTWHNLADIEDKAQPSYGSTVKPLYTGDTRIPVQGGFGTPGQIALQQDYPLPMNVLALIPEAYAGDTPQAKPKERNQGRVAP